MAAAPDRSYVCPVLIGRSAQVEAIRRAIDQAKTGTLCTVLVSGEAGIGKSRLSSEATALAISEGFDVLRGECFERGRALPFSAVLDLLRSYLAGHEPATIETDVGPTGNELVKLVPELGSVLPGATGSAPLGVEEEKHRLFYALLRFLSRTSERQPQVVLLEDLHWADATTLEFLTFLVSHTTGALPLRLVLLLTFRNDEVQPELAAMLSEVDRRRAATELTLERLTMAEAEVMVRATLDLRRPLRRAYLEELHALTGGNPFFIEEMLKASPATRPDATDAARPSMRSHAPSRKRYAARHRD